MELSRLEQGSLLFIKVKNKSPSKQDPYWKQTLRIKEKMQEFGVAKTQ